jgi:hypothetical protein
MPYIGDVNLHHKSMGTPDGWTPFWFEANLAWGMIHGPEEWARIKEAYPEPGLLERAQESVDYGAAICKPYYGFRMECMGPKTLLDFFTENGMEI